MIKTLNAAQRSRNDFLPSSYPALPPDLDSFARQALPLIRHRNNVSAMAGNIRSADVPAKQQVLVYRLHHQISMMDGYQLRHESGKLLLDCLALLQQMYV